jgi:hypothetical protein
MIDVGMSSENFVGLLTLNSPSDYAAMVSTTESTWDSRSLIREVTSTSTVDRDKFNAMQIELRSSDDASF